MILTKILFIVLILICAAFYILYIWDFALVLLVVMLMLPVFLFITTFIAKKMISVDFSLRSDTVAKNDSFPVQLCVTNRSIFPIGKAEARIEYYNVFNNQITDFELYFPIQSRNSQRITFQVSSRFCGNLKIRCAYISIFDPIRLFRFRTGKNTTAEVFVMPEGHDISGSISFADHYTEESTMFSESKPGDDPSEVFDLREYNPGDKLNRIHWKLSSKKDEFIVKDYSLPVDVPSAVFLDLKCYEDSVYTLPVFDTLIETVLSVSQFMIMNERSHKLIYFSGKENSFVERLITDQDALTNAMRDIIRSFNDNLYCMPSAAYFNDNPTLSLASFTYISSSMDTAAMNHIDDELDSEAKNAVIVVKNQGDALKLGAGFDNINIIPVVIGRISASIKDIEL